MATLRVEAWKVVALLWFVAVLNYLDRQMLATMGLSIKADIPELQSAEKFGQLMAVFLWVYAFCSPLGGFIADRFNRKWLIVASLGVWSSVTLLMGVAHNFHELYLLRAFMGISEALYIPAGLSLIASYHGGATRSLAVGIHMSGVYMGQALGGLGGWMAQRISWRAAFQCCGAVGVLYALVLMVFLRETKTDAGVENSSSNRDGKSSKVQWLAFIILAVCFTLPSLPGWAIKNWLPTLLQDKFSMAQAPSGLWATMINAGSAFCGVLIGGRLADRLSQKTIRGRTIISGCGLLLMVPALAGIGLAQHFPMVMACTAMFGLGFGMFDANNMPILCQIAPANFRATGYGLMNFVGIASGAFLTPQLGRLKDNGVPLATAVEYCAIPAVLAAALMFLLKPQNLSGLSHRASATK